MTRALLALPFLAAAVACGGAQRTGDESRSGAVDLVLGLTADDKVSSKDDETDWKRFHVDGPTTAIVTVYWDQPDVGARLALRDQFGAPLAEVRHAAGAPSDSLPEVRLAEGTYYVEVTATKGESVYTLDVQVGGPSSAGVPRPE
jgi:hypothetical protein